MKIDEWRDAGPGALSIEPLEVSRWRGEQDVLGLWVLNGDSGVNEERQAGGGAGRRVEMDAEDAE